jgi:hypothetical protein
MKTYEGVDVQIHVFLTSALVGGEFSASGPGRFTPGQGAMVLDNTYKQTTCDVTLFHTFGSIFNRSTRM